MYSNTPNSPPLHHPIPQHPIPPFRSPPPAEGFQSVGNVNQQSNPYIPQDVGTTDNGSQPSGMMFSGAGTSYTNFLSDPSAQIGIEVGRNALNYGQEYIGKNINQYVSVSALKYYFQVSNSYVLRKIGVVLFPWRHKPWSRQMIRSETSGMIDGYATARDDINAPDMYIPVMAFTTYVLLTSVFAGLHGTFHPKMLGYITSKAIILMLGELLVLKLGTYLLSAGSKLLDFVAYSGYKFIGITLTLLTSSLFSSSAFKWAIFAYTATSNSFFLLRSLRYILLPDSNTGGASTFNSGQRQRRIQFLFVYSFICQFVLMWFLL